MLQPKDFLNVSPYLWIVPFLSLPHFLAFLSAVALLVGEKVQEETTLVVSCGVLPGQWEDVAALQWMIVFS